MAFPLSLSSVLSILMVVPFSFSQPPSLSLSLPFSQFHPDILSLSFSAVCVCVFIFPVGLISEALSPGCTGAWFCVPVAFCGVGHILPELSQSHHPLLSSTPSPLSVRQSPHIHAPGIHSLKLGKYLGGKAISTFHLNHAANSGLCAFVVYLQTLQLLCRNKAVDSLVIVCRWSTDTFWLKDNQRRVDMLRTLLSIYRCVLFQH